MIKGIVSIVLLISHINKSALSNFYLILGTTYLFVKNSFTITIISKRLHITPSADVYLIDVRSCERDKGAIINVYILLLEEIKFTESSVR